MDRKKWLEFWTSIEKKSVQEQALEVSEVMGSPIDIDKPYPQLISVLCDTQTVSKDKDYFYFRITSPRVKRVYAIGSNGEVQLLKISKESLQTLTVSPLSTEVQYMPINDVLSAKGYDALATIQADVISSLDLGELKRLFAVLDAAVPTDNEVYLGTGEDSFTYKHLRQLRTKVKDYADKFLVLIGSNIDDDIADWDYDENKYRSIADMAKDLNVEIQYVGNYTLTENGSDVKIVDPDVAYLIGVQSKLDGKPFVFARKELTNTRFKDVEVDAEKQRIVQTIPTIIRNASNATVAVLGYWGYEECNVVCRLPLALAKFTRQEESE